MAPSDYEIGNFTATRGIQLKLLIEGHFLGQNISCKSILFDGAFGDADKDWLFEPGYIFLIDDCRYILSLRDPISRLTSKDPNDIARWIMEDAGHVAVKSDNDDIIAFQRGASEEIIAQMLIICNSATL